MEMIHDDYGSDMYPKMTNKEAAAILKGVLNGPPLSCVGRGNGKTQTILRHVEAYMKAIELLENTPD